MAFLRHRRGEAVHSFGHFNQAFFGLALFTAGSWNSYAEGFRIIEKRRAGRHLRVVVIEMQLHVHVFIFAFSRGRPLNNISLPSNPANLNGPLASSRTKLSPFLPVCR